MDETMKPLNRFFKIMCVLLSTIRARHIIRTATLTALVFLSAIGDGSAEPVALHDCLTEAIANNPSLKENNLVLTAGDQDVAGAKGKHWPKLSLDANYINRQDPLPYIPAQGILIPAHFSDEFAAWQAVLSVPIYQGGQIQNNVKLAQVRQAIKADTLVLTRNEIIANTVNTYNKLLQLQKLQKASSASVNALEEQRNNVSLLYNLGRVARVDLLKVEVQLSNENQRLASINEGLSASRETLAFLMGRSVISAESKLETAGELSFPDFSCDFEQGLTAAREYRPEYLIASREVTEADLIAKNSFGKLLPTVSAFGGYLDQTGFEPWHNEANWFTGINLSVPLFDRSTYADISRDRILKEKAKIHLTSVENQIRLDLHNAINSIMESRHRVEDSRAAVLQAQESFRIEQEKYATGAGTMVDLLLAQAADFTAAANYTQALFDYNAALVAYHRATGSLEDYLK
jgi:outer membrane protein